MNSPNLCAESAECKRSPAWAAFISARRVLLKAEIAYLESGEHSSAYIKEEIDSTVTAISQIGIALNPI